MPGVLSRLATFITGDNEPAEPLTHEDVQNAVEHMGRNRMNNFSTAAEREPEPTILTREILDEMERLYESGRPNADFIVLPPEAMHRMMREISPNPYIQNVVEDGRAMSYIHGIPVIVSSMVDEPTLVDRAQPATMIRVSNPFDVPILSGIDWGIGHSHGGVRVRGAEIEVMIVDDIHEELNMFADYERSVENGD